MDILKLATKDLEALLKRLPKEINRRKQQEESMLVDHIVHIASERGYFF